ncbi:uncharacterized protein LOC111711812 [Eurytemora carolleeae]|uniref:uncharacterized protein LOC111711812 n=1 Tax=Eurytemora carolleeae TaxID=1294199 RepID=UPI000C783D6A|nr:uncharacterized protein LOC111711812 [Eurytemora carolleeae]|eukprot:XP_023342028.1 uncharacterized protein LOC111711812 [Eurytemora affinis]
MVIKSSFTLSQIFVCIFSLPPDTTFLCEGQVPGYYADTDADCQLYHICAGPENGLVKYDFLCPNGTLFDQQYFVCNWWFNVDCALAPSFYSLNEDVLAAMEAANPAVKREGKAVNISLLESNLVESVL